MHSSADMSFLTIPSQEGLFKTIKTSKSAGEAEGHSRTDAAEKNDDEEDDEDDDDTDDVRFIPRCSPVPRKRGASIFDETAEYMRIHQALSAGKRVSFADTTGGDLVDVREFVAFDSDEEDTEKWQEEEAKYRKAEREPTYRVHPEFHVPSGGVLLQAVRSNKVEVERISPLEDEPLAFSGVIRVLNISFHKAVYIRSTMDSWGTYFDHPAEYVFGSNVDNTDQFSFKLSFAPPYTTHGSRIEFVVRYETSVGDYWANNFSRNYAVTLLLSYEDDTAQTSTDMAQKRSILKSPKVYSLTSEEDQEEGEEEPESLTAELVRPSAACPVIIHPEIDVEKPVHQSRSLRHISTQATIYRRHTVHTVHTVHTRCTFSILRTRPSVQFCLCTQTR
ncbi:protein phosphatase 1 regulatory subunit 3A isoform X1 [Xiphophorus hellerii]|uniref:protein phosphatase 1 regulatory subunit 3A isoform X1 n=1 Tax=Xiphophorus hellerii TaxID=8084 RepID=UPI0013B364A2|nr:protein phosphatase 1 regulatory subunit 3A-like isoform X1 [Xiphophorus hellerii]